MMICGSCGKPMRTNYHTDQRPAYECSGRADRLTTATCRSIAASTVDEAVTELLLNALNPNEIALALAAADEVADRHRRIGRAAELAVERARYEADRAERAFHAVEPDNRLVARSLESRWEAKLAALAQAEQALAAARDTLPPLPERAELEKLATDLPGLWHAPTTSNKDRKRLLRTVIADITLLPEPDHGKARIGIRWHTGASDEIRVDRAVHPGTAVRSPSPAVDMVTRLGPTTGTDEMVGMLNAAGMTTGHGRPFDAKAVQWRFADAILAPSPSRAVKSQPPQSLGRAQLVHELRDGSADFVGAVLLDEVQSGDGGLGEVRPRADEVADAAPDDGAWFGVDEQFGHSAFGQPAAVVVDHRYDVGGLAVDWDVAWPGQRRPAGFTWVDERLPVVVHFFVAELARHPCGQNLFDEDVLLQHHGLALRGSKALEHAAEIRGGTPTS